MMRDFTSAVLATLDSSVEPDQDFVDALMRDVERELTASSPRRTRSAQSVVAVAALLAALVLAATLLTSAGDDGAVVRMTDLPGVQEAPQERSSFSSVVAESDAPTAGVGTATRPQVRGRSGTGASPGVDNSAIAWDDDAFAFVRHQQGRYGTLVVGTRDPETWQEMTEVGAVGFPIWSPDASQLVVETSSGIAVIDVATAGMRLVTDAGYFPSWSPDGTKILASSGCIDVERCVRSEIFVIDSDGRNYRSVTTNGVFPSWTPDGRVLVTSPRVAGVCDNVNPDGCVGTLRILNVDGNGSEDLGIAASAARISPDGRQVAYALEGAIYVEAVDRTSRRRVSPESTIYGFPAWDPDGNSVLFQSRAFGLYEVAIDSGEFTNLASGVYGFAIGSRRR